MKLKFVFIIMLVTATFMLPNKGHAGITEALLANQALSDLKDVIKSIQPFAPGVAKRLNIFRVSLKKIIIRDKVQCEKPTGGRSFSEVILERANKIREQQCNDEEANRITDENQETITFIPKFEHCLSSADLKCVCSHKQHKDEPQCAGFANQDQSPKKKCIPKDVAENALSKIDEIINNLDIAFAADSDGNGISDICEDNL